MRGLRPARAHVPAQAVRAVQGSAQAHAGRPGRADAGLEGAAVRDGHKAARRRGLGGRRRPGHRRQDMRGGRLGLRDSHGRPRQLPAHNRADGRPAREKLARQDGDHRLHAAVFSRGVRLRSAADGRPQSPDGRRLGQHPRRGRYRREDRNGAGSPLRDDRQHLLAARHAGHPRRGAQKARRRGGERPHELRAGHNKARRARGACPRRRAVAA